MYRVFLSYNTATDEMVVVWRLQTLAAASGLHVEVPNPIQRKDWLTVARMINDADAVIAFLTRSATPQVKKEIQHALSLGKRVIPIVERGVSIAAIKTLFRRHGKQSFQIFELDPDNPGKMESELAEFLREERIDKDTRNAILALAGTVAGLFLLQELTQS
jgi:TIR domain